MDEEKNSGVGIASFVISIIAAVCMLGLLVAAGILHSRNPEGHYPGQTAVGFAFMFLVFADLVAVGLGIAALFQKARKKVLGIVGLVISSVTVLGALAIFAIGVIALLARR